MFNKSTDHGNDVMVVQFVLLFFTEVIFREASMEMDFKTVNVECAQKQIDNNFPWSVLFAVKQLTWVSWFHLSFEHVDVISMVNKSTDH